MGQQLWLIFKLAIGFIPFIAKPSQRFLYSWPN